MELSPHIYVLDLRDYAVNGNKHFGPFNEVSSVYCSVFVAEIDVDVKVNIAFGVMADNARGSRKLQYLVNFYGIAVPVSEICPRQNIGVTEKGTVNASERADYNPV